MVAIEKAWKIERKNPTSYFYKMTDTKFYGSYGCFPSISGKKQFSPRIDQEGEKRSATNRILLTLSHDT
jgi:hypothetical protein